MIRELGAGAMGKVYLARDPALDRRVALKLLQDHAARRDARRRFRDEARTLAALNHPGIVTIFEIGRHGDQDFIAMEYLPGRSLRELYSARQVSRDDLVAICAKVAVAVAAAHAAGILHRDIKPENVVVSDGGDVKVVDFGIAERLDPEARRASARLATPVDQPGDAAVAATVPAASPTSIAAATTLVAAGAATAASAGTGTIFGTPAYMAPEVLGGEESSAASDAYSLGVMLYEGLAGHRPYEGGSLLEVIARVIDGEPPPPLADPLADLVERLMASDPAARPELAAAAAELAPPSRSAPPRRGRALVIGLAIAAVAAASAGAIAWQLAISRHDDADAIAPASTGHVPVAMAIAFEPITFHADDTYGGLSPSPITVGSVLATLVGQGGGNMAAGPPELYREMGLDLPTLDRASTAPTAAQLRDAERRLQVDYVVRGTIRGVGGRLTAHLEVEHVADGRVAVIEPPPRPLADSARLMRDLAGRIIRVHDPLAPPVRTHDPALARRLTEQGASALAASQWYEARPFLEQAVDVDPTYCDAWSALADVRAWMYAPEDTVTAAIDRALACTPPGASHQLLLGKSQFFGGDFAGAQRTLDALADASELGPRERRDLDYYRGEAYWHDGEQARGVAFFDQVIKQAWFAPAMIHPMQYALARRDEKTATELILAQQSRQTAAVDFAMRRYRAVATGGDVYAGAARIVLGLPPSPADQAWQAGPSLEAAIRRFARALDARDAAARDAAERAIWGLLDAPGRGPIEPHELYVIVSFVEVVECANLRDELRRVLAFLDRRVSGRHVQDLARVRLLAAGVLGDRALIVRDRLSHRDGILADAMTAELAGDRAGAAKLLAALVGDPTPTWDYPERAALLRDLRALDRDREARTLCEDTLSPAIWRDAYLALRRPCLAVAPRGGPAR